MKFGDRNTHFFHLSTINKRGKNWISMIKDRERRWIHEEEPCGNIFHNYFHSLFQSSHPTEESINQFIGLVYKHLSLQVQQFLDRPILVEEIKKRVFSDGTIKSPRSIWISSKFFFFFFSKNIETLLEPQQLCMWWIFSLIFVCLRISTKLLLLSFQKSLIHKFRHIID